MHAQALRVLVGRPAVVQVAAPDDGPLLAHFGQSGKAEARKRRDGSGDPVQHQTGGTAFKLEAEFAGKGYGDFKKAVADAVVATLDPVRVRYDELIKDRGELDRITLPEKPLDVAEPFDAARQTAAATSSTAPRPSMTRNRAGSRAAIDR